MRSISVTLCATTILAGIGLVPVPAFAQEQASTASRNQLEDIVVTARRTSESLQTTPVAITAITSEGLERQQITSVTDLQRATPSLSVGGAGVGPASVVYLAIRGNAQNSPNSVTDAAVGIYVDGVYYARPILGNLGLLDIASAEVLRGPQGTLFGRNTTGGALNLRTVQPSGTFEGHARVGLGNYDMRVAEVALNAPLHGDELAARFAFRYNERDGYGHNPITGSDEADIDNEVYGRATLKWEPAALPVKVTVSGDYTRFRGGGTMTALAAINPAGPLATLYPAINPADYLSTSRNFFHSYGNPATGQANIDIASNRNEAGGVAGTIEADLGGVKLLSITAYRKSVTSNSLDLDATPAQVASFFTHYRHHQFSEELQFSGSIGDRLDWLTGFYYFKEGGDEYSDSYILRNAQPIPGFVVNLAPSNRYFTDFNARSIGMFAQVNYRLTDRLRATGGFRYTWDRRNIVKSGVINITGAPETFLAGADPNTGLPIFVTLAPGTCNAGSNKGLVVPEGECRDPKGAKFSYPAWTASLDYEIGNGLFAYAKTSGAAMSGGFNTRDTPVGLEGFAPEKVKDVELGFKGDFFDRRLRTNTAVFHNWRNGVQNIVNEFSNGSLTQYTRNAGDVRSYGIEFEGTLLPWAGMEITTAAAYLHSRYRGGSFVVAGVNGPVDRSGEKVQQAPKYTFSAGATQSFELGWGTLSLHGDYAYVSSRVFFQDTPDLTDPGLTPAQRTQLISDYATANALSRLDGYGLFNGRVTLKLADPDLEIAIWGQNLGNEKYFTNQFNGYTSLGFVENYQGVPRTYGVNVTFRW